MGAVFDACLKVDESRAKLNGKKVDFMFNPAEYSVTKTNSWKQNVNKSGNVSNLEFSGGEPRQLSLELFFDSYLERDKVAVDDVRKRTNMLFAFMMIDKNLKGKKSKMGRPPQCLLMWGQDSKFQFKCFIVSCNIKYTMFNEAGIPVRATASVTLKEAADPEDLAGTNPTSRGEPGRKVRVVAEGDRLDWIAYQEYNDATEWRRIAEANHITNPLALRPGIALIIPPL